MYVTQGLARPPVRKKQEAGRNMYTHESAYLRKYKQHYTEVTSAVEITKKYTDYCTQYTFLLYLQAQQRTRVEGARGRAPPPVCRCRADCSTESGECEF